MDSLLSRTDSGAAAPAPGVPPEGETAPAAVHGHSGLVYRTPDEFVRGVSSFVAAGVDGGDRVLVALPGEKIEMIRSALPSARDVRFVDMYWSGRNPARMIPTVRSFLDEKPGRRARIVGEPLWPGRSSPEV
ncbi:MAG TPA: MEDS domain-containing protein, partial [Acidimicrobiales bacterium]|nr:MEDS domain-containing protein [Acidimicrobiales bacterium]